MKFPAAATNTPKIYRAPNIRQPYRLLLSLQITQISFISRLGCIELAAHESVHTPTNQSTMSSQSTYYNMEPDRTPTSSAPPAPAPAPSALPPSLPSRPGPASGSHPDAARDGTPGHSNDHSKDPGLPAFILPKLRLQFADLANPASSTFLTSYANPGAMIQRACSNVLHQLYSPNPDSPSPSPSPSLVVPPTRSVTLILRSMNGVAYTTDMELDRDHKEIHFSLDYIAEVAGGGASPERVASEIEGVVTHELVHCLQYSNGCPGGLVEGVADWVRLRCGLAPPHWKRSLDGKWDMGYQNTAYFLEYLEWRFGQGTVRRLNEKLRLVEYDERSFWVELVGWPVERLWEDYCAQFKGRPEDSC